MLAKHARVLLVALSIGGCNEARPEGALAESGKSGMGNGGDHFVDPCGKQPAERALGWDAANAVGITPEVAFGSAGGTCKTTLHWSPVTATELATPPASLETPLVVSVAFDPQSARIIGDDPALAARHCAPQLQASATVQLASDDGLLRVQQVATVVYGAASGRGRFSLSLPLSAGMPGVAVALLPNESASLSIQLDGASSTCSGELWLSREMSGPDPRESRGSSGRLASWSNSSCPLGQSAVDLAATDGTDRPSTAALIEQYFGDLKLHGTWSDGPASDLTVTTSLSSTSACRDDGPQKAVSAPVQVTYASADGRVRAHTTQANVRIDGDSSRKLQLYVDETLTCESMSSELSYAPVDCSLLDHVTLQLGLQVSEGAVGQELSWGLDAYEYLRVSQAAPAAADNVRKLVSSPNP